MALATAKGFLTTEGFATTKVFLDAHFALLLSKNADWNSWQGTVLPHGIGNCQRLSFQMPMACSQIACIDRCPQELPARSLIISLADALSMPG